MHKYSLVILMVWINVQALFAQPLPMSHNAIDSLYNVVKSQKPDSAQVNTLYLLSCGLTQLNPNEAINLSGEGIALAKKIDFKIGELKCLESAAFLYALTASWEKGFETIYSAMELSRKYAPSDEVYLTNIMCLLYDKLGDDKEALIWAEKAYNHPLYKKSDIVLGQWASIMQMGSGYEKLNQLDSAAYFAEKTLAFSKIYYPAGVGWSLSILSSISIKRGALEEAVRYTQQSLNDFEEYNFEYSIYESQDELAQIYYRQNKLDSAQKYAASSLKGGTKMNNFLVIRSSAYLLSKIYENKDPAQSLQYLKTSVSAKDTITGLEKTKQINLIQLKEKQRIDDLRLSELANKNRIRLNTAIGMLATALLISLILYRNNRQKQKANAVLHRQKEEIDLQRNKAEKALVMLRATQNQLIEKEKIATDVAARLQELDAVKTRLYANVTHEFRTPLTVILGMTENIADGPKDPDHKNQLAAIKRNGQHLLHLVNQMLDLNKLESGALALHYRQGDVVNYIKYVAESFHSLAQTKNLVVEFHSEAESLMMDYEAVRLQQVVSNLLANAIKFTPENGKIDVALEVKNLEGFESPQALVLKIKDTGIGVAASDLPHIFDRFYQADTSATRSGEGTGIGLALAQELVKLMGGKITVSSVLGEGTEFTVALPVKTNEALAATDEISAQGFAISDEEQIVLPPAARPVTHNRPIILIADDNDDVCAYIASFLSDNYQLFMAKNGQECEEMAFTYTPDLIISDVMMPVKDGFEVCKTLKTDERTSHIPIIMLTAKADIESKLEGLERGADVYLMKPFHKEELLLRIKKLLELRRQLQQYYISALSSQPSPISLAEDKKVEGSKLIVDSLQNVFVLKVKAAIEARLDDSEFNIEKLSRAVHLSESQLQRKLGALTGISANAFIRHIRLAKAKDLLLHSPYSLGAIASDCGFNDLTYFGRIFKKEFGLTPHAWREQNA